MDKQKKSSAREGSCKSSFLDAYFTYINANQTSIGKVFKKDEINTKQNYIYSKYINK